MQTIMHSEFFEPFEPQRILAVGAHADDIDFGASGSLALFARGGAHVEYLVMTDGSKGSADLTATPQSLIKLRQQEQRQAAAVLGAKNVHFLGYEDGRLEVTQDVKKDVVRVIRSVRPDTVIVMDPTMIYSSQLGFINHPDHRAAGQATLDAVFPLARDHLSFPELYTEEQLEPHKVAHVLLINLEKQNCFIDITETFDLKLAALFKHASQIADREAVEAMLKSRAAWFGEQAGTTYAEGFVRIDPPN